jgi:MFS family permease
MHDTHHPVRDTNEPRQPQASTDPPRWTALAVLSLAQFMLILDLTVVNVALPDLGADLDLSRTAFTWTVSAYGLCFGGLLLLGGRLADAVGARPMMLTGLVIFTLASLASGLAQNEVLLLGGRIAQGVGAALLSPAALSAITGSFHGQERNKALSIWASLGGVGFAAGVLIGGILTAGPGWRWVFFLNVPVGIVLLAAIGAVVPPHHPDRAAGRLDVLGAVTVTAATGLFIYGMLNAGDGGWADPGTLLAIAAAIVLYGVFVVVEGTVPIPLLRLSLLARRPIATGAFLMLVASGLLVAGVFLGSQYLQHLRGLGALETGLFFLPAALGLMLGASRPAAWSAPSAPVPSPSSAWSWWPSATHCSSACRQAATSTSKPFPASWCSRWAAARCSSVRPPLPSAASVRVRPGWSRASCRPPTSSVPPSVSRWPPPSPPRVSPAPPRSTASPTPTPCSPSSPPWPRWSRYGLYRPERHR